MLCLIPHFLFDSVAHGQSTSDASAPSPEGYVLWQSSHVDSVADRLERELGEDVKRLLPCEGPTAEGV